MARPIKPWLWAGVAGLAMLVQAAPLTTAGLFFDVDGAAAARSIPGALILTLVAGAMFGLGWGPLLVGQRQADSHCFNGMSWWRDRMMANTRVRLRAVDRLHLSQGWRGSPDAHSRTWERQS